MHYIFYFDICAICILLTIAVVSLSRRWVPAYRQRAYGMLFLAVFIATMAERVETYLQMFPIFLFSFDRRMSPYHGMRRGKSLPKCRIMGKKFFSFPFRLYRLQNY